jgi:hypothetical protein
MGATKEKKTNILEGQVSVRTVDGSVIRGKINMGKSKRVSDVFLQGDAPYIVIYDAVSQHMAGKVFIVNKQHIVWVEPEVESIS